MTSADSRALCCRSWASGSRRAGGRKIPCSSRNIRNASFATEFRICSDMIYHVPFERGLLQSREEGKSAVAMELKRRATRELARKRLQTSSR